jgi:hypothetical protein
MQQIGRMDRKSESEKVKEKDFEEKKISSYFRKCVKLYRALLLPVKVTR